MNKVPVFVLDGNRNTSPQVVQLVSGIDPSIRFQ